MIYLFVFFFISIIVILPTIADKGLIKGKWREITLISYVIFASLLVIMSYFKLGIVFAVILTILFLISLVVPSPESGLLKSLYGWSVIDLFRRKRGSKHGSENS